MGRPTKRAPKEEVLAWIEAEGCGAKAASKHFGIPVTTIKNWVRAARASKAQEGPPKRPVSTAETGDHGSNSPASRDGPPRSPASSGNKGAQRGVPPKGYRLTPRGSRAVLSAESMDDYARTMLRTAVERLLLYLAGELEEPILSIRELSEAVELDVGERIDLEKALKQLAWSPRGAKEASIALGVLIDKCPDILAFEDKLNGVGVGNTGGPRGEAASRRVRAALGVVDP